LTKLRGKDNKSGGRLVLFQHFAELVFLFSQKLYGTFCAILGRGLHHIEAAVEAREVAELRQLRLGHLATVEVVDVDGGHVAVDDDAVLGKEPVGDSRLWRGRMMLFR